MSQRDVIDYLRTKPDDWVTTDEIAEKTGVSKSGINKNVFKLVKCGEIERKYGNLIDVNKASGYRLITYIRLTNHYKEMLKKEGLI